MNEENEIVCRCEEISYQEIITAIRDGGHTLKGVKLRTTAGMGLCQGRTCHKLVARLIKQETRIPIEDIQPATVRPPVRPLPIHEFLEKECE